MALLDSIARTVAGRLVPKLGKSTSLSLRRVTSGSYNTTTGAASVSEAAESISGIVTMATKAAKEGRIQVGDYLVTVAATDPNLTAAPTTEDRLSIDGTEYQIVDVSEEFSGDQVFLYQIAARA